MSKFVYTSYDDVESKAIHSIAHNEFNSEMVVTFTSGSQTKYFDVDAGVVSDFASALSVGSYYNNYISGYYSSQKCNYTEFVNHDDTQGAPAEPVDNNVTAESAATAAAAVGSSTYDIHYEYQGEARQFSVPGDSIDIALSNFKTLCDTFEMMFGTLDVRVTGVMTNF